MDDIYIDASGHVMGRLATKVAKDLLNGRRVFVINTGKTVISGNRKFIIKDFKEKVDRGDPYHGPFYPRSPEGIFKRVVKGMLPRKPKGVDALKRLRVYRSRPESLEGKEFRKIEEVMMNKDHAYMELEKLSNKLSVKVK
jgi:large subunit ribosomal protein L13